MPYYKRNICILSVTVFLASLSWQQVVPFLQDFLNQLGAGRQLYVWTGVIFAVPSLAAIIMQPLWGKLGDSYGRKPMIIRAGVCLAGVYFGMSICHAPWQLALCRFLNGALTGFIPGSFALIATNTPEELAPKYTATVQTASNVGLIIGPFLGGVLAAAFGYRGSMVVSGTAVLVSTMLVWLLVSEPNKVSLVEKTSLIEDFGVALRSRVQRSVLFVVMLSWSYSVAIGPYLVKYLEAMPYHAPIWVSARGGDWLHHVLPTLVFALPAVGFVLTAHRWTDRGSRWGYDRTIMVGLIGGGIGAIGLFFINNIWLFAFAYLATGVFTATLGPSIAALTCTRVDESFRGRAYGIQQSAGTAGAFVTPLIVGLIATCWSRAGVFVFVGSMFVVGAIVFQGMARRWEKPSAETPPAAPDL
jgi:MFS transporter, DHA1 family, multidrug resistance protein